MQAILPGGKHAADSWTCHESLRRTDAAGIASVRGPIAVDRRAGPHLGCPNLSGPGGRRTHQVGHPDRPLRRPQPYRHVRSEARGPRRDSRRVPGDPNLAARRAGVGASAAREPLARSRLSGAHGFASLQQPQSVCGHDRVHRRAGSTRLFLQPNQPSQHGLGLSLRRADAAGHSALCRAAGLSRL